MDTQSFAINATAPNDAPEAVTLQTPVNQAAAPSLLSEVYLVNTDQANRTVCRLAHHRSYAHDAINTENYNSYFGEPMQH